MLSKYYNVLNDVVELAGKFTEARDNLSVLCSMDEIEELDNIGRLLCESAKEASMKVKKEVALDHISKLNICPKQKKYAILALSEV